MAENKVCQKGLFLEKCERAHQQMKMEKKKAKKQDYVWETTNSSYKPKQWEHGYLKLKRMLYQDFNLTNY